MPLLPFDPMQDLQIVDSTHKLQEHNPRSAGVSEGIWELLGVAGRTMIDLPPLLGILARPSSWWRAFRLRILPIACPILFHYIGASVSRDSIELRRCAGRPLASRMVLRRRASAIAASPDLLERTLK